MWDLNGLWLLVITMSIGLLLSMPVAWAQGKGGVRCIGMTAADISYAGGQADQGFEGFRFVGYQLYDPLVRWDLLSTSLPPAGANRMPSLNPKVDRLIEAAEQEFDPEKQNQLLAQVHEIIVKDVPWVFLVHDLNRRALSPKVKSFVPPYSWFVDLTLPWVRK